MWGTGSSERMHLDCARTGSGVLTGTGLAAAAGVSPAGKGCWTSRHAGSRARPSDPIDVTFLPALDQGRQAAEGRGLVLPSCCRWCWRTESPRAEPMQLPFLIHRCCRLQSVPPTASPARCARRRTPHIDRPLPCSRSTRLDERLLQYGGDSSGGTAGRLHQQGGRRLPFAVAALAGGRHPAFHGAAGGGRRSASGGGALQRQRRRAPRARRLPSSGSQPPGP